MAGTDDSIDIGIGGSIGDWYLEDAGNDIDTHAPPAIDPTTGAPIPQYRPGAWIAIYRIILLPNSFNPQASQDTVALPDIQSAPISTIEIGDPATTRWRIKEDRLIKDDSKVGSYRQMRRYEYYSDWVEDTTGGGTD